MSIPEIDHQPLPPASQEGPEATLPWESIDPEAPATSRNQASPGTPAPGGVPQKSETAAAPIRTEAAAASLRDFASPPPSAELSDEHLSAQAFLGEPEEPAAADAQATEANLRRAELAPRMRPTGALSADEGSAPDPDVEATAPLLTGMLSDPGIEQPMQNWASTDESENQVESIAAKAPAAAPQTASIDLSGPEDESVAKLWAEPAEPEQLEVAAKAPAATLLAPAAFAQATPAARIIPPETPATTIDEASESPSDEDDSESEVAEVGDLAEPDDADDATDEFSDAPDALEADAQLQSTGGGWTIPLLCLGIGLIACCVIIPQADANGRLFYERQMLQADLESVEKQVAVNGEFIKRVMDDPTLAERLAGRQLKTIRKGQKPLALKHEPADGDMSPFALVTVAPPALPPPYKPVGGGFAALCRDARTRLYMMGAAMTLIATGLVLGAVPRKSP
ncbi:MAG TPA: hypothetical protein VG269_29575 [Tepidisphaeraceae bacterium]|jgi:hypothetical protein|nr:hypothetical protein [Tepidisphaeraceae bacterium]